MDPKILQAMGAIAQALAGNHPQEAQQIQQWVRAGGNYALPAAILGLALPLAPTVGVPATAILAALRGVQGGQPGGEEATRGIPMSVPGQRPPNTASPAGPATPQTGYGTLGYRGAIAGPSGIGAGMPSVFDNNQPGGAPGAGPVAGGPPTMRATQAPGPTGDYGSEITPQSVGLAPAMAAQNAATPAAGGGGNPGGIGNTENLALGEDDDYLLRFALKSAGFNPDVATPAEKIAAKYLAPMVQARRAAYGLNDPAGGNVGGLGQDIASFAKEFSTPGANFFGNASNYAKQILGGAGFANINGLKDPEQVMGAYASLLPLLYGGANPLVSQSAQDQTRKLFNMYKDADIHGADSGGAGIFQDWLARQKDLTPLIRSIFNMR